MADGKKARSNITREDRRRRSLYKALGLRGIYVDLGDPWYQAYIESENDLEALAYWIDVMRFVFSYAYETYTYRLSLYLPMAKTETEAIYLACYDVMMSWVGPRDVLPKEYRDIWEYTPYWAPSRMSGNL